VHGVQHRSVLRCKWTGRREWKHEKWPPGGCYYNAYGFTEVAPVRFIFGHTSVRIFIIRVIIRARVCASFMGIIARARVCVCVCTAIGQLIRITTIGSRSPVLITGGHDDPAWLILGRAYLYTYIYICFIIIVWTCTSNPCRPSTVYVRARQTAKTLRTYYRDYHYTVTVVRVRTVNFSYVRFSFAYPLYRVNTFHPDENCVPGERPRVFLTLLRVCVCVCVWRNGRGRPM